MENYERKGKEKGKITEEFQQRLKKLEQEWEAYKESKPKASHTNIPSIQT